MLDDDHKAEIRKLFDERDEAFEAKQELAIVRSVAEGLRTAEETRRSRMQFITAIGGATAIGAAVLIWSNITTLVEQRAENVIKPKIESFEKLERKFEEKAIQIEVLEGNVNAKLTEIERQLDNVRFALGALQTAEGGAALSRDLIELNERVFEMRSRLDAGSFPLNLGPSTRDPGPSIGDCVNPDGTFKPDC